MKGELDRDEIVKLCKKTKVRIRKKTIQERVRAARPQRPVSSVKCTDNSLEKN
jgi:hypothetical protein